MAINAVHLNFIKYAILIKKKKKKKKRKKGFLNTETAFSKFPISGNDCE